MAVPAWQAPVTGYQGNAGQVNQFLGAHPATFVYPGGAVLVPSGSGSGVYQSTAGQYLAQQFTAPVTAATSAQVQISAVGGSPTLPLIPPLVTGIYADGTAAGTPGPAGSVLAAATLAGGYIYSSPFWVSAYPGLSALTAGSVYWLVTSPAGTGGHYYTWQEALSGTPAMTSPDGLIWTALASPLMLELTGAGTGTQPQAIVEDDGARVTTLTWSSGQPTGITEQVAAQDGTTLTQSRSLTYTSGFLTGVT